jgi:hypothetical protein
MTRRHGGRARVTGSTQPQAILSLPQRPRPRGPGSHCRTVALWCMQSSAVAAPPWLLHRVAPGLGWGAITACLSLLLVTPASAPAAAAAAAGKACHGQKGLAVSELQAMFPPLSAQGLDGRNSGGGGVESVRVGGSRLALLHDVLSADQCAALCAEVEPLIDAVASKPDSVDGFPEFQLDLLSDPRAKPVLEWLWPRLSARLLPLMREVTQTGPLPLPWQELSRTGRASDGGGGGGGGGGDDIVRLSQIFVRRYRLPATGRKPQREIDRWQVDSHQDASDLSVSLELSAPESYEGGLLVGGSASWNGGVLARLIDGGSSATPLPRMGRGSASVHHGNVTHEVEITAGERWSMVIFIFRDCDTQRQYFRQRTTEWWRLVYCAALGVLLSLKWVTSRALQARTMVAKEGVD